MTSIRWIAILVTASVLACHGTRAALAQGPVTPAAQTAITMPFEEYMARVGVANLDAAAARASVPIAEAQLAVARVFPNPSVTFGLGQVDISGQGAPTSSYLAVNVPLELGGKRRRRLAVAETAADVTRADLDTYLRQIRTEAALAYVDALEAALVLDLRRRSLASFERLVEVNRHRFEHGDIDETTYLQSRVEAQRFRADLLTAEGEARAANVTLAIYASGDEETVDDVAPVGDLAIPPRTFDEADLLGEARARRPELVSRERSLLRAHRQLDLAHALRIVDMQLTLGWTHNGSTNEPQFRQHSNDTLAVLMTLPLPFANRFRGGVAAALGTVSQEERLLDAQRLRVGVEVRRAYAQYRAAVDRLGVYDEGLLSGADQVLERVLYEYQRGGATLLEVLNAQRTANEVHVGYYGALADHVRALIRLEAAVGTWDLAL